MVAEPFRTAMELSGVWDTSPPPRIIHGGMRRVDGLARAGRLDEARRFIVKFIILNDQETFGFYLL